MKGNAARDRERPGLIPDGAELQRVATGCAWSEGPVWVPSAGVVRWSDIPANRILEFTPSSGQARVHRENVEYTNGRTLDLDGSVIQCSHGRRAVEREVGGSVTTIVDRFEGKRLNSPNDVVVASDGSIWFTDPPYGIIQEHEGHPGEPEYGSNFVFRFDPRSQSLEAVISDVEEPNGLAFSPDESVLYVSDTSAALRTDGTGNHHIAAYDVSDRGCTRARVFAEIEPGIPDGFRVDADGRLWSSSGDSVQVFHPAGELIHRIPVPEAVSNLCFGGSTGSTLFITASSSLYSIETMTTSAPRPVRAGSR